MKAAVLSWREAMAVMMAGGLALSGCATSKSVTGAEGEGVRRTYAANAQQAWSAMQAAVAGTGGRVKEAAEDECRLVAGYPASAWSWGEWVALFCRPAEGGTEIEITMQPNLRTNVFPKDRVGALFEALDAGLAVP